MRRHAIEALAAAAAAAIMTLAIAAPVLRAPTERIFGAEIVGRHHDPFTVMQQFARPMSLGLYSQPVTDFTGAALARASGAVAAYNWLVLLTFPLAAGAAYLLARHLSLPPAAALLAALLFAFSPFHVAHAAYHPHVAQTQWLPLYLLALWRCMDRATWLAVIGLAAATAAVTLSNFYGGLIAAVITPVAVGAYWIARARHGAHAQRRLAITVGTLTALALAGLAFLSWRAPGLLNDRTAWAFGREDLFRYSAKWWAYAVPPVAHPLLGGLARRIWIAADVNEGLLEQQVTLGWGVVALAVVATAGWLTKKPRAIADASVPVLVLVAVTALVCSLAPERAIFGVTVERPSALLYRIVPMFRSYGRFGVIVQLMAALLAGIGARRLWSVGTLRTRAICAGLVMLAAAEYAVWPPSLWRDTLPTAAHRWAVRQSAASRVLDCYPATPESSSIAWLTDGRIEPRDTTLDGCAEPQLAARLWASGFTQVIVRDPLERRWLARHAGEEGLAILARFEDADLFRVLTRTPSVYAGPIAGFWPREFDGETTWRWMSTDASWTVTAPTPQPAITLAITMAAFHRARALAVRVDGGDARTIAVGTTLDTYRIGPLALTAGTHQLTFHSLDGATTADAVVGNGDPRALAFSIGGWQWLVP